MYPNVFIHPLYTKPYLVGPSSYYQNEKAVKARIGYCGRHIASALCRRNDVVRIAKAGTVPMRGWCYHY